MAAPGKSYRKGIPLMELCDMFPNEASAERWFEDVQWDGDRHCGHCGSINTYKVKNRKPCPYRCRDCKQYFSVRHGTTMADTNLPLRKWAFAVYLFTTNLKGVSSMKLHRDLGVTQKTAWFMLHRLREAWCQSGIDQFLGPVEVDETYMGGRRKNKSNAERKESTGRGAVDMSPVVGMRDRDTGKVAAKAIDNTDRATLQDFVVVYAAQGARVYTDEHCGYTGMPFDHETVKHSVAEYVRGQAHINGMESFWATLKRAHKGTYHKISPKHLNRYVQEFSGRHNVRPFDTVDQMRALFAGMVGKRLLRKDLIAN